jgi:Zn-dependent peptidase ImmA (M78 family)/transcriptional regulator with XRE-family HTH domain
MPQSPEVPVNPRVLVWARESDGASLSEVAKRLKITESELREMEAGERLPKAKHVRTLATLLHRSLATMLLPEPPLEPELPRELRTPTGATKSMARHTRQAIRAAREVQGAIRELSTHTEELTHLGYEAAELHSRASTSAATERERLGLEPGYQSNARDAKDAVRDSRRVIESQGIVTLMLDLDRKDARGLALTDVRPYLIVIGKRDAPVGTLFTLWHEYAHVLLASNGWNAGGRSIASGSVERWCNAFAGEFLVPKETVSAALLREPDVIQEQRSADAFIQNTASRLRVSAQTVFYRLAGLDAIPEHVSDKLESIYRARSASQTPRASSTSKELKIPRQVLQRHKYGDLYPRVVLNAKDAGVVGELDVADMLGLRVDRHPDLAELVFSRKRA